MNEWMLVDMCKNFKSRLVEGDHYSLNVIAEASGHKRWFWKNKKEIMGALREADVFSIDKRSEYKYKYVSDTKLNNFVTGLPKVVEFIESFIKGKVWT